MIGTIIALAILLISAVGSTIILFNVQRQVAKQEQALLDELAVYAEQRSAFETLAAYEKVAKMLRNPDAPSERET